MADLKSAFSNSLESIVFIVFDTPSNFVDLCYSLQYYYKSVKEIINYVRNPIQFQEGTKIFYIYTAKKIFVFILCLKSIGRYRLYLLILILLADTTKICRYHRYRYLSIGTSLLLYNAKDAAGFYSGHWNTGTNPDLAFASVGPNSCLLDRRVLEKFPRSQYQPLLITPPRFAMAVPSMSVKRWNFRMESLHCFDKDFVAA